MSPDLSSFSAVAHKESHFGGSRQEARSFGPLVWWVLACSYFCTAGWILSLLGALSRAGYIMALAVGAVVCWALLRRRNERAVRTLPTGKWLWRGRHSFPLLFYIYAVLSLLGGILYAPNNFDALNYRLPRVLHWLAAHRWHWIVSPNVRLNVMGCSFEWLSAPALALAATDRFLFLINIVCFLLLPGLLFGVFIRLGVSKKVAWNWMWLLPTGYCFVLQAGSIGNDLFSAVFCLAALYFALRARESAQVHDLWLSILAAGILTGSKASNLPLLLPWALALFPSRRLALTKPLTGACVLLLAFGASFLPTALANSHWAGSWEGDPQNRLRVRLSNPVYGLAGNSLQLLVRNVLPPVMPLAKQYNEAIQREMHTPLLATLEAHFPRLTLGGARELAQEEAAGIGLGMCTLLLVSCMAFRRPKSFGSNRLRVGVRNRLPILVLLGFWCALLVCMAKLGSESTARLLTPYYPLLFGSFLVLPQHAFLLRRSWWRGLAFAAALSALPPLVLSPARPLFPVLATCDWLQKRFPGNPTVQRAKTTYQVYRDRYDSLAPLREYFPEGLQQVGFVAGEDEPEASLWRPIGSKRVHSVMPGSEQDELGKQFDIAVVNVEELERLSGCTISQWLARNHLRVIGRKSLVLQVQRGPQEWLVVQTEPSGK